MSKKIFVGNLPWSVGYDKLKELFAPFGEVEDAVVIAERGKSKGFGFVTYKDEASAQKAISEMNEKEIEGRALKVNEAKPRNGSPRRNFSRRY